MVYVETNSDKKQLLLALSDDGFISTKIKGAEILSDSEIQRNPLAPGNL